MESWYILLVPSIFFPFLALRAEKMYRALTELGMTNNELGIVNYPSLSIIVPARNEEKNLGLLLPTLTELDYPGPLEILVVDDNSTDQTACVAQRLGARVVCAGQLPPGWLGKPHACHHGAEQATGDWLLFTDADTSHTPCGPRVAITFVLEHGLDGVSVFLRQETFGLDRSVLLAAFAGLYAGMHPNHPILNGQYILIRREAYVRSGGFAAVRREPLEDLALAHLLQKAGFRVPLLRGEQVGSVRMYVNTRHLWSGMTRIGAGALKWGGFGGVLTALYVTGALIPILATLAALWSGMPWRWAGVLWVWTIGLLLPWAIRFGDWRLAFVAPFGALFVQMAAVWGLVGRVLGRGVRWKGREVVG